MFLQEDFRVSPTASPGKEKAQKMSATSGLKCLEQFERFSRHGSWAKTFVALLVGTQDWSSSRCKLIWKLKGTKYSRLYFQLRALTLPTSEKESGLLDSLLPTPKASEGERGTERQLTVTDGKPQNISPKGQKYGIGIRQLAEQGFLNTPTSNDAKNVTLSKSQIGRHSIVGDILRMLPTPTTAMNSVYAEQTHIDGTNIRNTPSLATLAAMDMLPTPRSGMTGGISENRKQDKNNNLESALSKILIPTPRANKVNGLNLDNNEKLANRNKGNLEEVIAKILLPTTTT